MRRSLLRLAFLSVLPAALLLPPAAADCLQASSSPHVLAPGQDASVPDGLRAAVERARTASGQEDHRRAARELLEAAEAHPEVARWLRLSALQALSLAADTASARKLGEILRDDPVIPGDSVRVERARAAFRAGDLDGGYAAARGLGPADEPELWTRGVVPALLSRGDVEGAVAGLRGALRGSGVPEETGALLLALDESWQARVEVARSDLRTGRSDRARVLLGRALEEAPEDMAAELASELARAHLAAGDFTALRAVAVPRLDDPDFPSEEASELALAVGRSEVRRGRRAGALPFLRRAVSESRGEAAAHASFLLADLAHDRNDVVAAREAYRRTAAEFPATRWGGLSLIRLGLLAFRAGEYGDAARLMRRYTELHPDGGWSTAAIYWRGRALDGAGDREAARREYRRTARRDPFGYYGLRAAERTGVDPWSEFLRAPGGGGNAGSGDGGTAGSRLSGENDVEVRGDGEPGDSTPGALSEIVDRMEVLRALWWEGRALRELEAARRQWPRTPETLLAVASRLNEEGWTGPGVAMAWEVFRLRRGEWSEDLLRAVYPLPFREEVEAAARREGLDPALVAGLVRQESNFDPTAISRAGAVGLMQLMPGTAVQEAPTVGLDPGFLHGGRDGGLMDPETSLRLGTRHLARLLDRFGGSATAALIAYNAGASRYQRWRQFPEYRQDDELFIERIPFDETRRYVKAVYRNAILYRHLHGL